MDTPSLTRLLLDTQLFKGWAPAPLRSLVESAQPRSLGAGELLFEEGDVADAVYIVLQGALQVMQRSPQGPLVIGRAEPGDILGEMALLPGGSRRRGASVRAQEDSALLRIDPQGFREVVADDDGLRQRLLSLSHERLREALTRQSQVYQRVALEGLREGSEEQRFEDRQIVFREGDPAEHLYLVLEGRVRVVQGPEHRVLVVLEAGQCFGELGLLDQVPRSATVAADGPLRVLRVGRPQVEAALARSPELRQYLGSLRRVYRLRGDALVVQYTGQIEGREAITSVFELTDGRCFVGALAVDESVYQLLRSGAEGLRTEGVTDGERLLEVGLDAEGRIDSITALGHWEVLPELHRAAIEGLAPPPEFWQRLRSEGGDDVAQSQDDDAVLCSCLDVERRQVSAAIRGGCHTLGALRDRLGCGNICGTCVPAMRELLGEQAWTPVRLAEVTTFGEGVRRFRLAPTRGSVAPSTPGQHVVLQGRVRGTWVQRAYTLTSLSDDPHYELAIKREPEGLFTGWLFEEMTPASLLRVSAPRGDFQLEPERDRAVCFLAAGIGATPALAMLRFIARTGADVPMHLHLSVRSRAAFPYSSELEAATLAHEGLRCTLWETADRGRVGADQISELVAEQPDASFFLCGPTDYMDAVEGWLHQAGVPKGRTHREEFTHASAPPVRPTPPAPTTELQPPTGDTFYLHDPVVPQVGWVQRLGFPLLRQLYGAANMLAASGAGRPRWNPLLRWMDARLERSSGLSRELPRDRFGAAGALVPGPGEHALQVFERARKQAQRIQDSGRNDPYTPDGDTVTYLIPNGPLHPFTGPSAVDTGFQRPDIGLFIPTFLVRGAAAVERVLTDDAIFDRGPIPYHYLQQALGDPDICPHAGRTPSGIFAGQTRDNLTWSEDRAHAQVAFGLQSLELSAVRMERALEEVFAELDHHARTEPERVLDLGLMGSRFAFKMIVTASFGPVEHPRFAELCAELIEPSKRLVGQVQQILTGNLSVVEPMQAQVAKGRKATRTVLDVVREEARAGRLDTGPDCPHLIRTLLSDDAPGDGRLITYLFTVLFAGHETTGHALAWAMYETCRDPDLASALRREMAEFKHRNGGRGVRPADYAQRPLTMALILELGRRHTPLAVTTRTAKAAGEMPPDPETGIGAFRFPKHAIFMICLGAANMNPAHYDEPERFRPQRFFKGRTPDMSSEQLGRLVLDTARRLEAQRRLMTFGAGPAICPGRGFNHLEVFLLLDALLPRYAFALEPAELKVTDSAEPVSGPTPGRLQGRFRLRSEAERAADRQL